MSNDFENSQEYRKALEIAKKQEELYKNVTRGISPEIYFLEMYPSLIAYLNRIFIDGLYKFENGIEPPYLNRNWLMHGRMNRSIERYECIQILNALSVIEFMFGDR